MSKPIYQLYDEWLVRHQQCKFCSFSTMGPVQGPSEDYKPPTTASGVTMEEHLKNMHAHEVED